MQAASLYRLHFFLMLYCGGQFFGKKMYGTEAPKLIPSSSGFVINSVKFFGFCHREFFLLLFVFCCMYFCSFWYVLYSLSSLVFEKTNYCNGLAFAMDSFAMRIRYYV